MKAIVVRQPWASLIALGVKTIETRPSPPNGPMRPEGVRGLPGCALERGERIAIVAAAAKAPGGREGELLDLWHNATGRPMIVGIVDLWGDWGKGGLPLGAVVCTVTVADALPIVTDLAWCEDGGVGIAGAAISLTDGENGGLYLHNGDQFGVGGLDIPDQLPLGEYDPGRWGWLLADPTPCHPVPVKGRQGVFVLPDSVEAAVRAQTPPASTPLEGTQA